MTRERLQRLADDCEERARLSTNSDARSLYWLAARECRLTMIARDGRQRATFAAMTAQAQLARWYDGEDIYGAEPASAPLECFSASVRASDAQPTSRPPQGLRARQLAEMSGMSERGALKRIVHGFHKGLPGFYRDGCHWFAEREAFARFRIGAELSNHDRSNP